MPNINPDAVLFFILFVIIPTATYFLTRGIFEEPLFKKKSKKL